MTADAVMPAAVIKISLMDGAAWQPTEGGGWQLATPPTGHRPPLALPPNLPWMETLLQLAAPVATSDLIAQALSQGGMAAMAQLNSLLGRLNQFGCLNHTLFIDDGGAPLAVYRPLAMYGRFRAGQATADGEYRLSRFAYLRRVDGEWLLECPKGYAAIALCAPTGALAVHALHAGVTANGLAAATGLSTATALAFLDLLANAQALTTAQNDAEITAPSQVPWDFHDLLFHSRSRLGRHSNPFGGTYPFHGTLAPLPVVKPPPTAPIAPAIPLFQPDVTALAAQDPPFTAVMEARRSTREYATTPIAVQQLGELLYRAVRVKSASEDKGVSFRVYPGGGALHELEVYALVQHCDGLDAGLYHYDPLHHCLYPLSGFTLPAKTLVQMYSATAKLEQPLQVALVLTARFQRLQLKYQSMTYAAVLKHVGVVYEALYLVATAMHLAPCALGGGHSDLFGQLAQLDPFEEAAVGEFLVGQPDDQALADSRHRIAQALQAATSTGQSWGVK